MRKMTLMLATATAALLSTGAAAATIDFSGVPGLQPSPLVLPEATLTNLGGTEIIVGTGAAGEADGFCFLTAEFNCEADGEIEFSTEVFNLTFDVDGANLGDFVEIFAYNGATLLGSLTATDNGNLDFSSFGTITRLFFDDNSTGAGFGYSTFLFDVGGTPVPEPGMIGLLGLGLAGIGAMSRRRRAN